MNSDIDEGENPVIESSYLFPSRAALTTYFNGAAASLRAEMKEKFMDTGKVVNVERRIGTISFCFENVGM